MFSSASFPNNLTAIAASAQEAPIPPTRQMTVALSVLIASTKLGMKPKVNMSIKRMISIHNFPLVIVVTVEVAVSEGVIVEERGILISLN